MGYRTKGNEPRTVTRKAERKARRKSLIFRMLANDVPPVTRGPCGWFLSASYAIKYWDTWGIEDWSECRSGLDWRFFTRPDGGSSDREPDQLERDLEEELKFQRIHEDYLKIVRNTAGES